MSMSWTTWLRAFRQASPHRPSWINIETGEVKRFNPRKLGRAKYEALEERLYDEQGWVEVPYAESDDEFADMMSFAASPDAGKASKHLIFALQAPKPFRGFRTTLEQHQSAAAMWDANRLREAEHRLVAFCRAYDIHLDSERFQHVMQEQLSWNDEEDAAPATTLVTYSNSRSDGADEPND